MDTKTVAMAGMLAGALALAGCGGGGAKSPTSCPDGTVLKGSDCVPDDSSSDDSSGGSSSTSKGSSDNGSSGSAGGSGGSSDSSSSTPYDKDAVEVQLKRGARQVKGSCGGATDDTGQATGPWGQTKVTVTLGRNGRIKQVTVPAPYDGKPVGVCIVHAFQKLIFPPYAATSDVSVDWDVELVQPSK